MFYSVDLVFITLIDGTLLLELETLDCELRNVTIIKEGGPCLVLDKGLE